MVECDCSARLTIYYDTATVHGPWANLCPTCNTEIGVTHGKDSKLGTGIGQKYELQSDGSYKKIAPVKKPDKPGVNLFDIATIICLLPCTPRNTLADEDYPIWPSGLSRSFVRELLNVPIVKAFKSHF